MWWAAAALQRCSEASLATDMDVDTWESEAKNRPFWRKKTIDAGNTIERKGKRSIWKDGGKDTPEIQLKTAFIKIDGQPMMMTALNRLCRGLIRKVH